MTETILIAGGSGLLALSWAQSIRAAHRVILGIHRRSVRLQGVEIRPFSLGGDDCVGQLLSDIHPTIVINAAGMTSVEACETDPSAAQRINVELPERLARSCATSKIPFVHISTDHIFSSGVPLADEEQSVSPTNIYGRTKAEAERKVLAADPDALVVRTNFYAWGPSYRRSFSDFIIDNLRVRNPITLFEDVYYNPILGESLTNAVHELLVRRATGVFNVVSDERISKFEFGMRIAKEFELDPALIRPGKLSEAKGLVRRPHDMSLSNRKASSILGRGLGTIDEQLRRLLDQEQAGLAREIRSL